MSPLTLIILSSMQNMGSFNFSNRNVWIVWVGVTVGVGRLSELSLGKGCQFIAGPHALAHALTPMANSEFPVCLTVGFF